MNKKVPSQDELNQELLRIYENFMEEVNLYELKYGFFALLLIKYLSDLCKANKETRLTNNIFLDHPFEFVEIDLPEKGNFDYIYSMRNDSNISFIIDDAFKLIEESNQKLLKNVFDLISFVMGIQDNYINQYNQPIKRLIEELNLLDFIHILQTDKHLIGNAFDYLLLIMASEVDNHEHFFGNLIPKDFHTPMEVSKLLVKLVKPKDNESIYDPNCKTGTVLIKGCEEAVLDNVRIFGLESQAYVYSLAKFNALFHQIFNAEIACIDVLDKPYFLKNNQLIKHQVIVSVLPFSSSRKDLDTADQFQQFSWGSPPTSKMDYAYISHMVNSLSENGRMAIVAHPGVLYREGKEESIRTKIITSNLIDAVIGLPGNLFFGTQIPTVVLVFKNNRFRKDVLFIDASQKGVKDRNIHKHMLRDEDVEQIINTYENYETIKGYSHVASLEEIQNHNFNLNIIRYINESEDTNVVDINELESRIDFMKSELASTETKIKNNLRSLGLFILVK